MNATRIIKGGTSEKTPRCHWVMVVLVYRMERKSCRVEEWERTRYSAAAQGLWGEKKKKKKVHSTGLRYTPGLFSLSAKYIKKEKNPNELGFSSAPASSRPTRWLYRVWWDRFFKQAHHYIYSLSLSGYKLKEIPSIMLYYVGTGGSRRKKRDQEKRRRRVGDHQTSVFLLKREKIRVNGCSGFLSLYDEFAIKISRTSRNFILYIFSLSSLSLFLVTEQNKRVIMQYTYQIHLCVMYSSTHQCPTR